METKQNVLPVRKRKLIKMAFFSRIIIILEGKIVVGKYVGGENIFISKN